MTIKTKPGVWFITLKGVSGNLGMTALQALAVESENLLKEGRSPGSLLENLGRELKRSFKILSDYLRIAEPEAKNSENQITASPDRELLLRLKNALEKRRGANARSVFEELEKEPCGSPWNGLVKKLDKTIKNYDWKSASVEIYLTCWRSANKSRFSNKSSSSY